jgi:hypothetical protein
MAVYYYDYNELILSALAFYVDSIRHVGFVVLRPHIAYLLVMCMVSINQKHQNKKKDVVANLSTDSEPERNLILRPRELCKWHCWTHVATFGSIH